MGIGISLVLIAAGAILAWGVDVDTDAWSPDVVGIILLVVGALGLLWSLAVSSAMPWHRNEVIDRR